VQFGGALGGVLDGALLRLGEETASWFNNLLAFLPEDFRLLGRRLYPWQVFVGIGAAAQAPISLLSRITAPAQDELRLILPVTVRFVPGTLHTVKPISEVIRFRHRIL
jgi:hypothetical protein